MTVLSARDLHKTFGPQTILDGVTLTISADERVGLVGLNGSGKSTLARILAGLEQPESGSVAVRRGAQIGYLAQDPKFDESAIARDVVLAGLVAWSDAKARHEAAGTALAQGGGDTKALLDAQAAAAFDVERLGGWNWMHDALAVMGHVGVSRPDAPMGTLSGGDRRRVALARLLLSRPDLAILDEPSNHLDAETVEWLEQYLREEHRGALLLITHDRYLLDRVADRTLEIDRAKIYSYDGGYEDYLEAKAERIALAERTESNRQNFLRRELEWLRRQPKARTGKQKARIDRAEAARDAPPPKAQRSVDLAFTAARGGKTLVDLVDVTIALGERVLVSGLTTILAQGERVGIVGRSATGKTTLLRAILGEVPLTSGRIELGKNTSIAYFDQLRSGLDEDASVAENVARGGLTLEIGGKPIDLRTYLERFLFDTSKQRQPVGSLSGGERARVALAKLLARPASLVVLDEPTNDLDVATLSALEQLLVELDASALIVTHDRYFLDRVATAILAFEGEGKVVRYAGNYDAYRTQRAHGASTREPAPSAATAKAAPKAPVAAKAKKLTYAERIELDSIMERIDQAESAVAELEARLAEPTLYAAQGALVPTLLSDLERAKKAVADLTNRWEELEAKKGE